MSIEIRQVVKQFLLNVPGVRQTVKARISHSELNDFYHWEVSHHYRPANAPDFLYPARVDLHTLAECESALLSYMRHFTDEVEVNEDF
jgi:hypothetical protein